MIDWSVYVEVDSKTQLDRRIYRDQTTRGYKHQEIMYQWENHVLPCYNAYIEPYKQQANVVFKNDERSERNFSQLMIQLNELLIHRGFSPKTFPH
jgi:uridine kinase